MTQSTVDIQVPSIAETELTGRLLRTTFARRGKEYTVDFYRCGISILCDGVKVRSWGDLPKIAQNVIAKVSENYANARLVYDKHSAAGTGMRVAEMAATFAFDSAMEVTEL